MTFWRVLAVVVVIVVFAIVVVICGRGEEGCGGSVGGDCGSVGKGSWVVGIDDFAQSFESFRLKALFGFVSFNLNK